LNCSAPASRNGSALMLALVTVVILSVWISTFLFRSHIESDLAARARFGMKADALARGGQDIAKWMILKAGQTGQNPEPGMEEAFFVAARNLQRGVAVVNYPFDTPDGTVWISIEPESSRRNVNRLSDADWEQLLGNAGVPSRHHARIIALFRDWTDGDDFTRLLGAESDDPFYQDLELPVKNAPVDHLGELSLIKGFTSALLHGGRLEEFFDEPDTVVSGILPLLTVHGDGAVNVNSASREVLLSLSGLREEQADRLIEGRSGLDQIPGTEHDGYASAAQAMTIGGLAAENQSLFTTGPGSHVRITTFAEVGPVRRGARGIYEVQGNRFFPVTYEPLPGTLMK